MKVPTGVLKAATIWPAAVVSFALFAVAVALAPPMLAAPVVLAVATLLIVLATGRLEAPVAALLINARAATPSEHQIVTPVVHGLSLVGVTGLQPLVRRRHRASTPAVTVVGRDTLVLAPGLLESLNRGWVRPQEAVALAAHAVASRHARRPYAELAGLVATSPFRAVLTILRVMGATFGWLPFVRAAWALRGAVAVVCVVQSVAEERAAAGALGALVIALTYLVPAADQALQERTELISDQFVMARGLGGALADVLTRCGDPVKVARLHRLRQSPSLPPPIQTEPMAVSFLPTVTVSLN